MVDPGRSQLLEPHPRQQHVQRSHGLSLQLDPHARCHGGLPDRSWRPEDQHGSTIKHTVYIWINDALIQKHIWLVVWNIFIFHNIWE